MVIEVLTTAERDRLSEARRRARSKAKTKIVPAHKRVVGVHFTAWLMQRIQKWNNVEISVNRVLNHIDKRGRRPEDHLAVRRLIRALKEAMK